MEKEPVIFALWQYRPSEILAGDSIHIPHLQKPRGQNNGTDVYIFKDPLLQCNCITPFGRRYGTTLWHEQHLVQYASILTNNSQYLIYKLLVTEMERYKTWRQFFFCSFT